MDVVNTIERIDMKFPKHLLAALALASAAFAMPTLASAGVNVTIGVAPPHHYYHHQVRPFAHHHYGHRHGWHQGYRAEAWHRHGHHRARPGWHRGHDRRHGGHEYRHGHR